MVVSFWASIIILASAAFWGPYLVQRWKYKFYAPDVDFEFKFEPPYCHLTEMRTRDIATGREIARFPVYYCRFAVVNKGKLQADDCEAVLEKVWKEDSAGNFIEWRNFSAVTLKWSGPPVYLRTIQPKRKVFCDIGRIHHPQHEPESMYLGITGADRQKNKFFFEIREDFFVQWNCLVPGKYRIQISVYGKNVPPVSRKFEISWSGEWRDTEEEMFKELVISSI